MATVQFDIDGVLADFMHGFTRLAREMGFGNRVSGSRQQVVWEQYGDVPSDKVDAVWANAKASPWFWEELPALIERETFSRIDRLQGDHDIYFATSRPGRGAKLQTVRWLRAHGISHPTVVITSKKGETAVALGARYAIDDKTGNALFTSYMPGVQSYILDAPHNRFPADKAGARVRRVHTVDEFLNDVEEGK